VSHALYSRSEGNHKKDSAFRYCRGEGNKKQNRREKEKNPEKGSIISQRPLVRVQKMGKEVKGDEIPTPGKLKDPRCGQNEKVGCKKTDKKGSSWNEGLI